MKQPSIFSSHYKNVDLSALIDTVLTLPLDDLPKAPSSVDVADHMIAMFAAMPPSKKLDGMALCYDGFDVLVHQEASVETYAVGRAMLCLRFPEYFRFGPTHEALAASRDELVTLILYARRLDIGNRRPTKAEEARFDVLFRSIIGKCVLAHFDAAIANNEPKKKEAV